MANTEKFTFSKRSLNESDLGDILGEASDFEVEDGELDFSSSSDEDAVGGDPDLSEPDELQVDSSRGT